MTPIELWVLITVPLQYLSSVHSQLELKLVYKALLSLGTVLPFLRVQSKVTTILK